MRRYVGCVLQTGLRRGRELINIRRESSDWLHDMVYMDQSQEWYTTLASFNFTAYCEQRDTYKR